MEFSVSHWRRNLRAFFRASTCDKNLLAQIQPWLTQQEDKIFAQLCLDRDGLAAARARGHLIEVLLQESHSFICKRLGLAANHEGCSLVATGGTGRGYLAPFSDVDILFLVREPPDHNSEEIIRFILYLLYDLHFAVGHAVRSGVQTLAYAREDLDLETSLLEARYICGSQILFHELEQGIKKQLIGDDTRAFIYRKYKERNTRWHLQSLHRYALQPDVKNGVGGLRDLQALRWMVKHAFGEDSRGFMVQRGLIDRQESARFRNLEMFFWRVRWHLHRAADRAEERLSFDYQEKLAQDLGFRRAGTRLTSERLMRFYFLATRDVGIIERSLHSGLDRHMRECNSAKMEESLWHSWRGFFVRDNHLSVKDARHFIDHPLDILRIHEVAQERGYNLHPETFRLMTRQAWRVTPLQKDVQANEIFMRILTVHDDPEKALRRLNTTRILERFIPEFGKIIGQVQYDLYHQYTVDDHTLRTIGVLKDLELGHLQEAAPLASRAIHQITGRRALYCALLLHDVAKGQEGDHSQLGAKIVNRLGPRLGLGDEETRLARWLVRWHLLFSRTAFSRDLDNPAIIRKFARFVGSLERLRLLLVLTVADIRTVAPGAWTPWKAALLRDLYLRSEAEISGVWAPQQTFSEHKDALARALPSWSLARLEHYGALFPPMYWRTFSLQSKLRHAMVISQAQAQGQSYAISLYDDDYRAVTEILLYSHRDHTGLFADLTRAISSAGVNIKAARPFTLSDGCVFDFFVVTDNHGNQVRAQGTRRLLQRRLEAACAGEVFPLPSRRIGPRHPQIEARCFLRHEPASGLSVVETIGQDRPGLLALQAALLADMGISLLSARVETFGYRVEDVFLVKEADSHCSLDATRADAVKAALLSLMREC